ncbi:MAG: type 1 glutamine amidotransferase [Planctomycetota bacterium]|nr:type 1 glutamine amidotransferase [Planctomycetota bacterium]
MPAASPQVVLIQVRERPDVEAHEQACVIEQSGIAPEQLRSVNALHEPDLRWEQIAGDAILIGGAGVLSVTDEQPFTRRLTDLVREGVDRGVPMLGLCWGHQFIAKALGGEVVTDESRKEVGAYEVELVDGADAEPLLQGAPQRFMTLMGHKDRVERLPAGGVELAKSALCRNQMFRIDGKPVFGAQFHIEMTPERLRERLDVYHSVYLGDAPPIEEDEDDRLAPTPEANRIMRRFFDLHVG